MSHIQRLNNIHNFGTQWETVLVYQKFSQVTYLCHNGRKLVQKWAEVWIQTTTHKFTFPCKTSVTRQSSLQHINQISSGRPALGAILLKNNAQQIRNKVFTCQNTTSIADIYFISFKVIRWQHVSASIIGPSSGHNRMKYEEATYCNS